MKFHAISLIAFSAATLASPVDKRQDGNGPYGPGVQKTESSLQGHTIYMPSKAPSNLKLPVLVWGNGGCGADGTANALFLKQVASYGYLAIASGAPGQQGGTNAGIMKQSIDWATSNAGKGSYANVDASKIMAAGFSCGGVEAYAQIYDSRVDTIGIFSSGLLENQTAARTWTKPILYVLGGNGDIAYGNGERDYNNLPSGTPSWKGNLPLGHGGDLFSANGGRFGKAGINWLEYLFRGDQNAKAYFNGGSSADQWQAVSKSLDRLPTFS
ncbi:hypothetical protein GRF29_185g516589 [Pseudopithomyces chartarum]|uniref:Uncharacterized protein n=1 Tax=Pseudopithomyces chartarum TaxID=1892770 RepID=A0AAN6RDM6_9PLEO|nr:hypothetical protein GRF29_185g516589 [Pseudopithomyces chartarum]